MITPTSSLGRILSVHSLLPLAAADRMATRGKIVSADGAKGRTLVEAKRRANHPSLHTCSLFVLAAARWSFCTTRRTRRSAQG